MKRLRGRVDLCDVTLVCEVCGVKGLRICGLGGWTGVAKEVLMWVAVGGGESLMVCLPFPSLLSCKHSLLTTNSNNDYLPSVTNNSKYGKKICQEDFILNPS